MLVAVQQVQVSDLFTFSLGEILPSGSLKSDFTQVLV